MDKDKDELIAELYALKLATGLSRGDKEIIDKAIKYIESH